MIVVGVLFGGVMIHAVAPTGTEMADGDIVADIDTNVTAAMLMVLETTSGPIFCDPTGVDVMSPWILT